MSNSRKIIDAAREVKVYDEHGHELDRKPTILFPGNTDPAEIAYAGRAGLKTGYMNENNFQGSINFSKFLQDKECIIIASIVYKYNFVTLPYFI